MKKSPSVARASKVNFLLAAAVMVFMNVGRCQAGDGLAGVSLHPRLGHIRKPESADISISLKARERVVYPTGKVREELKSTVLGDRKLTFQRIETRKEAWSFTTKKANMVRDKLLNSTLGKRQLLADRKENGISHLLGNDSRLSALGLTVRDSVGVISHQTNIFARVKRHVLDRDELIHNNEGSSNENDQQRTLIAALGQTSLPVSQNNDNISEESWEQIKSEQDNSKKHRCRHRKRKKGRRRRHRFDGLQQKSNNHNEDNEDRGKSWSLGRSRMQPFLLRSDSPSYFITSATNLQKDWCRTVPLRQTVVERGCRPRTIMNSFCYGQCNSFFIPRTDHKSSTAFQSCAFCKPHRSLWTTVTLHCPGLIPPVRRKKVLRIETCRCIAEILR